MDASPLIVLVAAGVAALAACTGAQRARGSTAVPAAWWAAAACLALGADAAARCAGAATDPLVAARFRLLVAALAVCPTMSLLGAKRPQHGVWQVIVAALAVVVAMPAVSAWLVRPGSLPDVHPLGRGFLAVLLVAGWLNFVGTGRAFAATCIVAGQFALLRPFLPGVATDAALPQPVLDATGALLVAAGALAAALRRPQPAERSAGSTATGVVTPAAAIDPPFLALRETLGAAWTLRIMERFDMVADERGWPCRLRFGGLETGGDPTDVAWHRDALRAFRALVRRFVDDRWLARHGWPESA